MSDRSARRDAVRIDQSVIVQAPAGSGKTTLLVERYLGLLAVVEAPEEILAITFTRKAAAEMRERVLRYLDPQFVATAEHEQAAWNKAQAVNEQVAQWQLLANPNRLLIRTIDSFNHFLARSMPVASALGPAPTPADNTQALHRQAARRVLQLAESDDLIAADLERLLEWRDHQHQQIENLLATMLNQRDQWLRALTVAGGGARERQEAALQALVNAQLLAADNALTRALAHSGTDPLELLELLQGAADHLTDQGKTHSPITAFRQAQKLPDSSIDSLPLWRGLGALMLISKGATFRKVSAINKTVGFEARTAAQSAFTALFEPLREDQSLAIALDTARALPQPQFSDEDWQVLESLINVLARAAAELELLFAQSRTVDYPGLAAAALLGLGDEEHGYSDLGLYLDQRISHILVDEFQDTNWSQLKLLEKLTAGWTPDDGRTLFLVGDPMQSIYRFREAEVGLFIRSRDSGIGAIQPQFAQLTHNFRSRAEIVTWVNERLGPVFPTQEDIAAGAVTYAASEPAREAGGAVALQAFANPAAEGAAIADQVAVALAEHADDPDFKAAIIVRARSHLGAILPALTARNIRFRAVKLDPLLERPVVQDLLAITRAILQPADRTARLAVLRSPPCGLTIADLLAISDHLDRWPVAFDALSTDGQRRAAPVLAALQDATEQWRRVPLRDLVEGFWHRIGGPACCQQPDFELTEAQAYLDALEMATAEGLLSDWNDFAERLEAQFTQGDPASDDVRLEVLTMHGAKGLEWDLVILPELQRRPAGNDPTLLHWLPFTGADGAESVLLAPLRQASATDNNALIKLIQNEQKQRDRFEIERLLYVATTRARERLLLTCCLDPDKELAETRPPAGSLLGHLWPTTGPQFHASLTSTAAPANCEAQEPRPNQALRRVASDWQPVIPARVRWQAAETEIDAANAVEFNWAGVQARRTGSVLHRLLEVVGSHGVEQFDDTARQRLLARAPTLLQALGTQGAALDAATEDIADAFANALRSDTGRWLLSNTHADHHCELALSGIIDGRLVNAVIDRTFVDAEGVRWIIDYKTGFHQGADLPRFFAEEAERYREQLTRYRKLFAALEDRPIKTALYLPRHGHLELVDTQ